MNVKKSMVSVAFVILQTLINKKDILIKYFSRKL